MTEVLERARLEFENREDCSLLLFDKAGGEVLYSSLEAGIKPLFNLLSQSPDMMNGTVVADKIIGCAAALLCVYGKGSQVYGQIMSIGAKEIFEKYKIPYLYDTLVDKILNRDKTDICPMERITEKIYEPERAYAEFLRRFAE